MKVSIFAYSKKGCELALRISNEVFKADCYAIKKFSDVKGIIPVEKTSVKLEEIFNEQDLIIFVGACGIAVRSIAPLLKSKVSDPACLVVDECQNFVISLLSGHIGFANDYCKLLAEKLSATPVITTATDVNNKFAVDYFAKKNNLHISDMKLAMGVSAKILTDEVPIMIEKSVDCAGEISKGLKLCTSGELGVYIGYKRENPYIKTLRLVPKSLHIGIGCRRDTPLKAINEIFEKTINENNIDENSIKTISSIDLKSDERALLEFSKSKNINPKFYTSDELNELQGDFTKSELVKSVTGVDNVCERAAYKSAINGKIIIKKQSLNGVTIAIVEERVGISFE